MKEFTKYFILFAVLLIIGSCQGKKATPSSPGSERKPYYISAKSGANLREEPNRNSRVMTLLPYKTKIYMIKAIRDHEEEIDGVKEIWYLVEFGSSQGYVFGAYLAYAEPFEEREIIGKYELNSPVEVATPSVLELRENHQFAYKVNLCHKMGNITGRWNSFGPNQFGVYVLELMPENSDFGYSAGKLRLQVMSKERFEPYAMPDFQNPKFSSCEMDPKYALLRTVD